MQAQYNQKLFRVSKKKGYLDKISEEIAKRSHKPLSVYDFLEIQEREYKEKEIEEIKKVAVFDNQKKLLDNLLKDYKTDELLKIIDENREMFTSSPQEMHYFTELTAYIIGKVPDEGEILKENYFKSTAMINGLEILVQNLKLDPYQPEQAIEQSLNQLKDLYLKYVGDFKKQATLEAMALGILAIKGYVATYLKDTKVDFDNGVDKDVLKAEKDLEGSYAPSLIAAIHSWSIGKEPDKSIGGHLFLPTLNYDDLINDLSKEKNINGYEPEFKADWITFNYGKGLSQGWKLHVGSTVNSISMVKILRLAMPILLKNKMDFKIIPSLFIYEMQGETTQRGKFITIYPKTEIEANMIADILDHKITLALKLGFLRKWDFSLSPGDAQLGDTGDLSVRYGAFSGEKLEQLDKNGKPLQGTKGETVEDNRSKPFPNFVLENYKTNPFGNLKMTWKDFSKDEENPQEWIWIQGEGFKRLSEK